MSEELVFSIDIEKELKKVMVEIFADMAKIQHYAGVAFCTEEDESESKFWRGQYLALNRTWRNVQTRMFRLQMKREEKEEAELISPKPQENK